MTSAADAMESILAANPVLNDYGFGPFDVARFAKDRAEMLSPYSLERLNAPDVGLGPSPELRMSISPLALAMV